MGESSVDFEYSCRKNTFMDTNFMDRNFLILSNIFH